MAGQIALTELKEVLKLKRFKSFVTERDEHYIFVFSDIYIFRDGKPLAVYELVQTGDNFKLVILEKLQNVFTENFKNVILAVSDDSRFPVVINFDGLALQETNGFDITLEAE
jgi:hypothetical protein